MDTPHSAQPLDQRAQILLKTLIERYIADGQPIGSRALAKTSGLEVSPATIRNVMADLEDLGFIASPHTSAGRIPTARGYRFFVDSLLSVRPLEDARVMELESHFSLDQPQRLISAASQLLSELTRFAGVVVTPRTDTARIRQIEFVGLSERRILLIIVTATGDVQNRILFTERPYSANELVLATNFLNENFIGQDFDEIRSRVRDEMARLRADMSDLMAAAIAAGQEAIAEHASSYVISGERNLLEVDDLSSNMGRLRELFRLFESRTSLLQLLDLSRNAQGVQIYIGGESGIASLDECTVIAAPYKVDGQVVGSVGVVGPTRMSYEKVIPIVDITARLLSAALSPSC